MEIKYIDDDPNKGVKYDWRKIRREMRRLKIPKEFFDPLKADPERCGYNMALSDRSRGKTTQAMLLGMVMYQHYQTITHYFRDDRETITPKQLQDLFQTIIDFNYIDKITKGRWNSVFYYGKRWFYCNRNDLGEIEEKAPSHFCICMSLDDSDRIKSSYNCPRGDLIIFDEFIQLSGYGYSDFIRFSDMVSTIFRKRQCGYIIMLSNTIDINSPWFDEFCIRDSVELMQSGEARYIETEDGTRIFVEIMSPDTSEQRQYVNRRFFGFPNPKLAAITGKGTWATEHYPHIPSYKNDEPKVLYNRVFVKQSGKFVKLQVVRNTVGLCVYVHSASKIYDDSIILTSGDITDRCEVYGFGAAGDKRLELIWRLYKANRFYYATNSEGALIRAYIKSVQTKQRERLL